MSPRLPALQPREVIRTPERAGFPTPLHSHHDFKHPTKPGQIVMVPVHPGDLKRSALASILKQAGLTTEEFLDLL